MCFETYQYDVEYDHMQHDITSWKFECILYTSSQLKSYSFSNYLKLFLNKIPFDFFLALFKAQNDVMAMKIQSERLSKEYDRLLKEHSELQVGDMDLKM